MRQKCMGLVGQPGVDQATGEHSHVPSKEKTSTYRTVGELGPEPLRGVQAAAVLFKPPNCTEGVDGNGSITALYCSKACVAKIVGGFCIVLTFQHLHKHHQAFQY